MTCLPHATVGITLLVTVVPPLAFVVGMYAQAERDLRDHLWDDR